MSLLLNPMSEEEKEDALLFKSSIIGILLALVIFFLDFALPVNGAGTVLYIAVVLAGIKSLDKRYISFSAIACSILVVLGYFQSAHPGQEAWKEIVIRSLALLAIGTASALALNLQQAQRGLRHKTALTHLLQEVAVASNESRSSENAMRVCLSEMCKLTGWPVGHVYLREDQSKDELAPSPIWYFPDPQRFAAFKEVTEKTRITTGIGLPGRVLMSGKPEWLAIWSIDSNQEEYYPRANLLKAAGVRGGFAFPILIGTEIVGVMEFFFPEPEAPDSNLLSVLSCAGTLLGRAIERDKIEKIQQTIRENLEREVRERTSELTRINQELQNEALARKLAKEELDHIYRQNELILTSAGEGIFGLAPSGKFVFINPAAAHMFAFPAKEMLGKSVDIILNPPSGKTADRIGDSAIYAALQNCISIRHSDETFWRRDGASFPVEYTCTSSLENGTIIGAVVTFKNITDRKHAEKQKEELLAELSRTNKELQEFAYIVSHDLKEPLRGIFSLAQWIMEDYPNAFDANGRQQFNLLMDNTKRMHRLIEGILAYSRIGREKPDPFELHTGKILQAVLKSLAIPPDIHVRVDGVFPVVLFHPIHLEQVFQNLVGNAIKHLGKPKGEIMINCRDNGEAWEFCVRDDGVGIEARHFERIFKIFQTLKKNTKNYAESTGIGLALVKKILETHGEKIWVESTLGKGTAFFFTIAKSLEKTKEISNS